MAPSAAVVNWLAKAVRELQSDVLLLKGSRRPICIYDALHCLRAEAPIFAPAAEVPVQMQTQVPTEAEVQKSFKDELFYQANECIPEEAFHGDFNQNGDFNDSDKLQGAQVSIFDGLAKPIGQAFDQSSRYVDLSLVEEDMLRDGRHVLVTYIMKPKAGYDYLATAAQFAAASSTGTRVNVCTTDDFTKTVNALVYYIDPEAEEMKIAYPTALFDRNITDSRALMCSVLSLSNGGNQGRGGVEYRKICDLYFPPEYLRLFDGPTCSVIDMWRILGRGTADGGLVVGTIVKPKLGLQPKPFGEVCFAFWQGGDFIENDESQGNQVSHQMNRGIPEVVKAIRACVKDTWGPLGLSSDEDVAVLQRHRETEIYHGRASMLATMKYILPELTGKLPGHLSPSMGLRFEDVPNGLAAVSNILVAGWAQIMAYVFYSEYSNGYGENSPVPGESGFKPSLLATDDPELKTKRMNAELASGRLALMAILGMIARGTHVLSKLGPMAENNALSTSVEETGSAKPSSAAVASQAADGPLEAGEPPAQALAEASARQLEVTVSTLQPLANQVFSHLNEGMPEEVTISVHEPLANQISCHLNKCIPEEVTASSHEPLAKQVSCHLNECIPEAVAVSSHEPLAKQVSCRMNECIPEGVAVSSHEPLSKQAPAPDDDAKAVLQQATVMRMALTNSEMSCSMLNAEALEELKEVWRVRLIDMARDPDVKLLLEPIVRMNEHMRGLAPQLKTYGWPPLLQRHWARERYLLRWVAQCLEKQSMHEPGT